MQCGAHNPCKLSSQYGSQSTDYAGRASACSSWTGPLPVTAPGDLPFRGGRTCPKTRFSVGSQPYYQSHGPSRPNWPSGQSGNETQGRCKNGMYWKRKSRVLGLGYLTTRTGPEKNTKFKIPPCPVVGYSGD